MNQDELLGLRLLSLHNLRFLLELTRGAREAIERREFASFKRDALERLACRNPDRDRSHPRPRLVPARACPQRRRARMHAAMQDSIEVGDEIITAGGLHGVVRELGESELQVEIAPNVVATLDRRAVAAVGRRNSEDEISDETPPESS